MLEGDNRVILPELTHVRFIISSGDIYFLDHSDENLELDYDTGAESDQGY
jgi:hypothetical protein